MLASMKLALVLLVVFVCLPARASAADFWETKNIGDWSDKEVQKLATNSPWARQAKGVADDPGAAASGGIPEPGSRPAAPEGLGGATGSINPPSPFDSATRAASITPEVSVFVRWLTSLPMRQAQMRAKYGKETDSSPAAKQYIEKEPSYYTLGIAGVPGLYLSAFGGDRAKEMIQKSTTLTPKGKEPLRPVAVEFISNGATIDVLIAFPRVPTITLADHDTDFSSRLGTLSVRCRFRLKDMQVRGKLEL